MDAMPMFVIYQSPADYPGQTVVRRWSIFPGVARAEADVSAHAKFARSARDCRPGCSGSRGRLPTIP